jgi:hypothetical protein
MKIRRVRAEFFHVDGRTDVIKLVVTFRNFANAPKNTANFEVDGNKFTLRN